MRTLAQEIEQGLNEQAGNEAMQRLAAETMVVAMELADRFGGDLGAVVEEELRRREEFVFANEGDRANPRITVKRMPGVPADESVGSAA
jgi:hypothetical protein